jgi:hypothetical protein
VGRPGLDPGTLGLKVLVKSLRRVALRLMVSKTRRWKAQSDGLSDTAWNGVRCVATQLLGPLVSIDWDGSLFKLVGRPGLPPETLGILTGRVPIARGIRGERSSLRFYDYGPFDRYTAKT